MVKHKARRLFVPFSMALLLPGARLGQEEDYLAIRTVLVSVTDETGAYIPGLGVDDFEIAERGVRRDIDSVTSSERETEITLAVDTSVAVSDQIPLLRRGAEAFVRAVTPGNRVSLYEFGGRARPLVEPTNDAGTLIQAIKKLYAQQSEAAYVLDAIVATARDLEETEQEEGNPAQVVIVATNGPELSHNHHEQAKKVGERSGAVYHVVLLDSAVPSDDLIHSANVEGALAHLADETGGTFKRVMVATAIEKELGRIAVELRPRYEVSFLTEVSPRSKLEELSISVTHRNGQTELIRLLPEEKTVPVSN